MIFLSDDALKYIKRNYIKNCMLLFINCAFLYTISKKVNEQEEKINNLEQRIKKLEQKEKMYNEEMRILSSLYYSLSSKLAVAQQRATNHSIDLNFN